MKTLDFKTVSPLYEMERDGIKPFTERLYDYTDSRFRALSQWNERCNWAIRIENPDTGESFVRLIQSVDYLRWVDWHIASEANRNFWDRMQIFEKWRIIVFGESAAPEGLIEGGNEG